LGVIRARMRMGMLKRAAAVGGVGVVKKVEGE
jgi:hypothetical protein